jgi:hypothetical protein
MVARSDGEHYGRMRVFRFPKQKVVFGPRQIIARINQDQTISPQITLWNQQGSEVLQGTLLVIPIEESLLYVRPLYLRSAGGRIPELKRVIVAHQNQIVMEATLEEALERLFPSGAARATLPATPAGKSDTEGAPAIPHELSARALEHYRRAIQAQREGNWAVYGEEITAAWRGAESDGSQRPDGLDGSAVFQDRRPFSLRESDRDLLGDADRRIGRALRRIQVLDDSDQRESAEAGEEHRAERDDGRRNRCHHERVLSEKRMRHVEQAASAGRVGSIHRR